MNKIIKSVVYAILTTSLACPAFAEEGSIRFAKEGEKVKIDGTEYTLIEEDTTAGEHIYKVKDNGRDMCIPAWDCAERREGGFCSSNERPAVLRIMIKIKNHLNEFIESKGVYFGQVTSVKKEVTSPAGSKFTSYSYFDTAIDIISAEGKTEAVFFKTCSPDVAEQFCGEKVIGLTEKEVADKYGIDNNGKSYYNYCFEAGDTYMCSCRFTFNNGKVCEISFGEDSYLNGYTGYLSMQLPEANLMTLARATGDSVRIRQKPVDGSVIGKVNIGDFLYVHEFQKQPNNSVWARISLVGDGSVEGIGGWMHSDYVNVNEQSPSANTQMVNTLNYYYEDAIMDYRVDSENGPYKVWNKDAGAGLKFGEQTICNGDDVSKLKELLPLFKNCRFNCPETIESDDWAVIEDMYSKIKLSFRIIDGKINSYSIEKDY